MAQPHTLWPMPDAADPAPYEDLPDAGAYFQGRSSREGADYDEVALHYLASAGATVVQRGGKVGIVPVDAVVRGTNGRCFVVLAHGNISEAARAGLRRTDTVRKLGTSAYLLAKDHAAPLLVLTSHLPPGGNRRSAAADYLAGLGELIFDVVVTKGDLAGYHRLRRYLGAVPAPEGPEPAPWRRSRGDQLVLPLGLGSSDA
ncbi:MAG TPA: hypothetical protein VFJ85_01330 [Acidimicrobiales bacterium]|nr:hypothetical protein [Acidimicrobiales bacterium]